MRKILIILFLVSTSGNNHAQELYVYSEPASNMPAHAITVKMTGHIVDNKAVYDRFSYRLMPEVQFGISKKLMFHIGGTIANMHTPDFRYESVNFYAKYRFLSKDELHKHFRMAAFIDASATDAPFHYDEITLMGDKSGIGAGLIATQLWNKFALSGTVSHTQVLDKSRNDKVIYVPERIYQSMNYSLSGGLLVLPKAYTDYKQTNVNVYMELLAEQTLGISKYYIDAATALQFIFNSNAKLNLGYRYQLSGNMRRMAKNSWQVSFERTFLNALKGKQKDRKKIS